MHYWEVIKMLLVALRKESVDRNVDGVVSGSGDYGSLSARRAWIEMGWRLTACPMTYGSLSARRAWIEIVCKVRCSRCPLLVALRKESVDRNISPPPQIKPVRVALRKESVDRNVNILHHILANCCRSPQGERG